MMIHALALAFFTFGFVAGLILGMADRKFFNTARYNTYLLACKAKRKAKFSYFRALVRMGREFIPTMSARLGK